MWLKENTIPTHYFLELFRISQWPSNKVEILKTHLNHCMTYHTLPYQTLLPLFLLIWSMLLLLCIFCCPSLRPHQPQISITLLSVSFHSNRTSFLEWSSSTYSSIPSSYVTFFKVTFLDQQQSINISFSYWIKEKHFYSVTIYQALSWDPNLIIFNKLCPVGR